MYKLFIENITTVPNSIIGYINKLQQDGGNCNKEVVKWI